MEGGATPALSVVVPAHNEEAVIARCLTALLQDVAPDVIDVVVVCNGCTDRTADIAASFGVRVLSTPAASKSAALNLGDDAARHFPRAYVDADVEVTGAALMQTASALAGGALAAAPGLHLDLAGRSWAVRSYYRVWSRMRDAASDVTGSGAYVLSEDGRRRFDRFPQLIADDLFVRELFSPEERVVVAGARSTVRPPRTVRSLVNVRTRVRAGTIEYRALRQGGAGGGGPVRRLLALAARPRWWPALGAYGWVSLRARVRARSKLRRGELLVWERDESARKKAIVRTRDGK